MRFGAVGKTSSTFLMREAEEYKKEFGQKFQAFSKEASSKFERYIQVKLLGKQFNEREQVFLAIYAAVIFAKYTKTLNLRSDNFFQNVREKAEFKEIVKKNNGYNIEGLLHSIEVKVTAAAEVRDLNSVEERSSSKVLQLLNDLAGINPKNGPQTATEEHVEKIRKFFAEDVCFLNYDKVKDCLKDIEIKPHRLYVLKAKDLFFILIKQEQIIKLSQSSLTHLQFADIFDIKSKLEISAIKGSKISTPTKQKKEDEKAHSQIALRSNINVSNSGIKDLAGSRIKSSVIFPQNIKCHICCKEGSEFNAVFWNYSYTCVECVLNPQKDTSFIPANIIDKFLKGQQVQQKQYFTICPECKSDSAIPKYKPSNKPKSYRCSVCMKEICIEHQRMIIQCFCQCKCGKKTLSIPHIYAKYCLSCKIRLCELCGTKSDKECACICPLCGQNTKVNHQVCTPNCFDCKAQEIQLIKCNCEQKLCPKCFFSHLQPGHKQCILLQQQAKI